MRGVGVGLAFHIVDEETVGLGVLSYFGNYCIEIDSRLLVGLDE